MKWNGIAAWGLRIVGEPRRHAGTRSSRLPQPGRRPPDADQDAYPIERYAWEVMLPYHFEREAGGTSNHVVLAELTQAPGRNVHVGIKAPLAITDPGGGPASGVELSGFKLYGLYNFNTEGAWLPALSLRTDLSLPCPGAALEGTRPG